MAIWGWTIFISPFLSLCLKVVVPPPFAAVVLLKILSSWGVLETFISATLIFNNSSLE